MQTDNQEMQLKERFLHTVQPPLNQHGRCFLCYFQLWCEESPELFLWQTFFTASACPSCTLCAGCPRAAEWQTEGGTVARVVAWASGTCDPHGVCVTPSRTCLGRTAWSLTPHWLRPLLGKRFLSGKGFLRSRMSGCCTLKPYQIAAAATANTIWKAGIHVFYTVLLKGNRWFFCVSTEAGTAGPSSVAHTACLITSELMSWNGLNGKYLVWQRTLVPKIKELQGHKTIEKFTSEGTFGGF